jgi:hypothetical protein
LLGFEEAEAALVGEGDFLFEGSVLSGDGGGLGVEADDRGESGER